ncbi:MAG: A/G-specific adenine glycosylase [Candidatus Latescibacterota bacterium]|nr:A/G-specific adenine glycosylase [Candidatus Latescibacterota bacterium]
MTDWLGDRKQATQVRRRLLDWFRRHQRRNMPWRQTKDPYRVWVSEIMLQQTRVAIALGYYERFLSAFPTLEVLAAADEQDVLKSWEGMGYYARARNLHRAAKMVIHEFGGQVPDTYEGLLQLPGIGPYTAAAVSSIASDGRHPVLDGNVTRLLCRLLRIDEDPRRTAVKAELIAAGERLVPERGSAGEVNQAMMELGGRVCRPRKPLCGECPLADDCRALQDLADPVELPMKVAAKERPHYEVTAGLIWNDSEQLLLARRPPDGMLGGLWEFPGGKQEPRESLSQCLRREILEELDFEIEVGERVGSVEHGYSHFSITLHAFIARHQRGTPKAIGCDEWRWVRPANLDDFPMPRSDRRLLEQLEGSGRDLRFAPLEQ